TRVAFGVIWCSPKRRGNKTSSRLGRSDNDRSFVRQTGKQRQPQSWTTLFPRGQDDTDAFFCCTKSTQRRQHSAYETISRSGLKIALDSLSLSFSLSLLLLLSLASVRLNSTAACTASHRIQARDVSTRC
ncbi:unnamed protein product, partial [Protopolystoma xenopodis]